MNLPTNRMRDHVFNVSSWVHVNHCTEPLLQLFFGIGNTSWTTGETSSKMKDKLIHLCLLFDQISSYGFISLKNALIFLKKNYSHTGI